MKKFWVSVPIWASTGVEVKAENAAEAIKKAERKIYPTLCHECSREVELNDPDWDHATAEEIID